MPLSRCLVSEYLSLRIVGCGSRTHAFFELSVLCICHGEHFYLLRRLFGLFSPRSLLGRHVTNVVILAKQLVRRKAMDRLSLIIVKITTKYFGSRPVVF